MVGSNDSQQAFLFLLPMALVFSIFLILPIIATFVFSFSNYDLLSPPSFVGLKNYISAFQDTRVMGIFLTTFKLAISLVLLHSIIGLLLALFVQSVSIKMQGFYRFILYTPVAITTASMAIAWKYIFNRDFGIMNWLLNIFNLEAIPWLTSSQYVFTSILIFSVWKFVGTSFLYFLIGLNGIPNDIYEASYIDGAGPIARFFRITLPMLTPTILFVVTVLFINTLQIFDEPFFLTNGGPGDASRTVNLFIYEVAFRRFDLGYSSALAVLLFLVILIISVSQNKFSNKWVNYDR
ncbi:sugar ABC transporter permease [Oceanispirochaeta crateris]|uniref:Sugar ABC transporter permease n=1 Tax=Oceanispirochaeta crateris TaxID=2518645 RepID=A0A5C1QP13_9SPIO|nr:sugar ABC transporter permease [Oceanispirochaeta crateris]QEN08306.1 sugar ABC transporter permease [Oceanispirochaeta crateris]